MLSERVKRIDASGIRKVFDLAATMKNPINLSIGQPDFDVPEPVKEAAIAAIRAGHNRYTVTQGIPELHAAIRAMLKATRGFEPEATLITSAVSGGLTLAFLAAVNPGDEVIIPDPYFVIYKHLATLCGAKPVFLDTYPDFRLRRERLAPLITERTKMVVVNSPCNPTGSVYSPDELRMVADLVRGRDIVVVSDESYEAFVYDGAHVSMASVCPQTLLLSGYSKTWAMTGWRLGYAAGPGELIAAMTKLQQYTFVCAPAPVQRAGIVALGVDTSRQIAAHARKRNLLWEGLRAAGYEAVRPQGAFYFFPKVPWGTDMEFVEAAIRNNLLIIPGSVFSERNTHFRVAYPVADATIERGLEVLRRLARDGR